MEKIMDMTGEKNERKKTAIQRHIQSDEENCLMQIHGLETAQGNLTDKQWEAIKEYFPSGNKSKYHKRSLVEAVLYIVKKGCQWRMLPHDYPPHDTV